METEGDSLSKLDEKEIFKILQHTLVGDAKDHEIRRIKHLTELRRRIESNSIQDINGLIISLLEIAKKHGDKPLEFPIIVEILVLLTRQSEEGFEKILSGLKSKKIEKEEKLFLVFSKLVKKLDYEKKQKAIQPLVRFLTSQDDVGSIGVKVASNLLLFLGEEKLGNEIVKEILPYLNSYSFETCAIVFSVKLCSKFAEKEHLQKMLEVLEKSIEGYYNGLHNQIERDICAFLERIKDRNSIFLLMKLLKSRYNEGAFHISKAIGKILDAHPYATDDVLDMLYDTKDQKLVDAILRSIDEIDEPKFDPYKLISKIRIKWWYHHPTKMYVQFILEKLNERAKPVLFEILKDKAADEEKFEFALQCLKKIGASDEELYDLFPKSPMLQMYNFFYEGKGKKLDLSSLWKEKDKLGDQMPGKPSKLDHLIAHIFSCFNFSTLVADPSQRLAADLVCFFPTTLDLLIIGCTTGVLQDDLKKMDALIGKMEQQLPDVFTKCTITPIVVSTSVSAIHPSDEEYSAKEGIVILGSHDVDKLLEMLNTGKKPADVLKYIEKIRFSQLHALDNSYS